MLNWCNRFNICCFLDNHNYQLSYNTVECLAGAGASHFISKQAGTAFEELFSFSQQHRDWLFGHFGYDLKNETEKLSSSNADHIELPDLFFFVPTYVLVLNEHSISIGSSQDDHQRIFDEIVNSVPSFIEAGTKALVHNRYSRDQYIQSVRELQQHILRGDCYEINLCQEFYAENTDQDPLALYLSLSRTSPNPFSAYYRINDIYTSCLSPERYLKKDGNTILSQPIKGTAERDILDSTHDRANATQLAESEKERAENIMVVDLVRNDLSRICEKGTVHVDELCAVYSFPQVHQMISTISGQLRPDIRWTDAIKATFPMGSMTGAPKKRVMELIEEYELTKRGLFSGSIGYVTPDLNFDFNVVIRSLIYHKHRRYISFHTGSAITFSSDPEVEYSECLLKAAAIKKALAETNTFH
jgi:para-aminobenzoate synthetase component 1